MGTSAALTYLACYILLCFALMGPMLHAGISLAITVAAGVQLVVLLVALHRRLGTLGLERLVGSLLRAIIASGACGAVAWYTATFGRWEAGGNTPLNIVVLVAAIAAGGAAYVSVSLLLRSREARELLDALRRRKSGRARGERS